MGLVAPMVNYLALTLLNKKIFLVDYEYLGSFLYTITHLYILLM